MEVTHYTVTIQPAAEGGFWAEVPALPGCFSKGDTFEEATTRVREAIECHLACLLMEGESLPVEKTLPRRFAFPVVVRTPRLA